ncbi:hypothetical protein M413DRAFT_150772 [Hebeloma cylindrosporum]|uniref:Uncharacterized protein n=1 Tax=Hebeloma cylindrosporum TaxID=76867 RepID=A0A0C2XV57_HEBCY|nr:hypothetical protein M413DRAFT_150772 [Hebeloma cylindrosporum h7]
MAHEVSILSPDRDNYPPTRETLENKNFMLAGHARAGTTSSAFESVEASRNRNLFDQPR